MKKEKKYNIAHSLSYLQKCDIDITLTNQFSAVYNPTELTVNKGLKFLIFLLSWDIRNWYSLSRFFNNFYHIIISKTHDKLFEYWILLSSSNMTMYFFFFPFYVLSCNHQWNYLWLLTNMGSMVWIFTVHWARRFMELFLLG